MAMAMKRLTFSHGLGEESIVAFDVVDTEDISEELVEVRS